ncbi:hypothetical protein like AT1G79480 [Hibiscus trionum]|uniref:X8 domain-containing protein n=1 Tax=Hibiscus trionum TaxID=183268 RepID=A0A9W7GSX3_HIBTR|nr:hypothetical protein like AT1G79480 [Hibiscus trionum]
MGSKICTFLMYSTMATALFIHCDARKSMGMAIKHSKKLQLMNEVMSLVIEQPTNNSNTQAYGVSSPFSLPPFDSLPPVNPPPSTVPTLTPTNPSPFRLHPSPLVFLPPIVYPPPTVPPPPNVAPTSALWCVAKPSVPDPIIQEAMNYACAGGADCDSIQPSGSCFQPDSLFAHASYAFNSYWQKTKVDGGTCEFGGTAILVAADPSYDGCQFEYHY